MKDRAHMWLLANPEKARKMLAGKFTAKDIDISRFVEELHRFGYIQRVARLPGDRSMWEATTKLKRLMR